MRVVRVEVATTFVQERNRDRPYAVRRGFRLGVDVELPGEAKVNFY